MFVKLNLLNNRLYPAKRRSKIQAKKNKSKNSPIPN